MAASRSSHEDGLTDFMWDQLLGRPRHRGPGGLTSTSSSGASCSHELVRAQPQQPAQSERDVLGGQQGPSPRDDSKEAIAANYVTATKFRQIYALLSAFLVFPLAYVQLPAQRGDMDDMATDDSASQFTPLGNVFIALAIVVWTLVAGWLCQGTIAGVENGDIIDMEMDDGKSLEGSGDLSDGVISRVAHGFLELLLEGKDKSSSASCDARTLDLTRLEELFAPPAKPTAGGGASSSGSGGSGCGCSGGSKTAGARTHFAKEAASLASTTLSAALAVCEGRPLSEIEGAIVARAAAAASADDHDKHDGNGASDLAAIREQLREKLSLTLGSAGRKGGALEDLGGALASDEKGGNRRLVAGSGSRREALEDFLKQLLHLPLGGSGARDEKPAVAGSGSSSGKASKGGPPADLQDDKESGTRPATMLLMAEHAREIGNKYLQERHFAAAAHCYEVACLLYPADRGGSGSPGQLAAYHCNCALACLELGRYGDAINEGNAALVLTPPKHIAVKALYRLAVAHANLKNAFEARRCLRRCLEFDPGNEYALAFLHRLGEEPKILDMPEVRLTWIDPPKKLHFVGAAVRDKAKGRKAKHRGGGASAAAASAVDEHPGAGGSGGGPGTSTGALGAQARLEREAGLWHTVARYNNKLYVLGGWAEAGGALGTSAAKADGGSGASEARGSDELHVLDVETFELRQLSGPHSKPPHACYCHTATMVGTNMVVFGGCGPPVDQPPLVMVFDVLQAKWKVPQPVGVPPRQRQGHTANAVQGDRQLCIFGGIEPTREQRVARVYSDAHLLDLQSFSWRKLEVVGHRPPARFGHTATNLPGNPSKLLVVGGRDHLGGVPDPSFCGSLSGLHILDTDRRAWVQQPYSGTPPTQAFYHSACVVDDSTILYMASWDAGAVSVPLHVLDLEAWRWSTPKATGPQPAPRIGHTATRVGNRVYVFGGVVRQSSQNFVDKSVYVLDASLLRATPAIEQQAAPQQHHLSPSAPPQQHQQTKGVASQAVPQSSTSAPNSGPSARPRHEAAAAAADAGNTKGSKAASHAPRAAAAGGGKQVVSATTTAVETAAPAAPPPSPTTPAPTAAAGFIGNASAGDVEKEFGEFKRGKVSRLPWADSSVRAGHLAKPMASRSLQRVNPSVPKIPPPLSLAEPVGSAAAAMNAASAAAGPAGGRDAGNSGSAAAAARPLTPPVGGETDSSGSGTEGAADAGCSGVLGNGSGSSAGDGCPGGGGSTPGGSKAGSTVSSIGYGSTSAPSRDERIEMMLRETDEDDDADLDDATGLSFEELLEQEKAFFRMQSFPRVAGAGGSKEPSGSRRAGRF